MDFSKLMRKKRDDLRAMAIRYDKLTPEELLEILRFGHNLFSQGAGIIFSEAEQIIRDARK